MGGFEVIEEINDGNLYLRKLSKEDVTFFYQSLKNKDITNYLSLGPLISHEHSRRLIKNYLKSWDKYLQFNYVIELRDNKKTSRIGSASLWNINWFHQRSGIGIWILPMFWERGIGTKTITLIKIIGFNHLKLNRIEAHIAVKNDRSIKMFKKCGFIEEGTLKGYLNINGGFQDALLVACLKN
ncbi:MAG: GNAT family N-acetyltransferase [Candidatus Lokiarchaeota archaeon]|nr:GNAT family N-acetyltransferase [Candidatus Lokiarchaeota archaeon]